MKIKESHYQKIKDFYVKSLEKVLNLHSLQELDDFYNWFFSTNKQMPKIRLWHTSEWKSFKNKLLLIQDKCQLCGSDIDLRLQHLRPWLNFIYFNKFYNTCSFYSWQNFRKLRKEKGKLSKEFVFYFYKFYLAYYFKYILDYINFKYVAVYCKFCAFKDDIFLATSSRSYLMITDYFSDLVCSHFYYAFSYDHFNFDYVVKNENNLFIPSHLYKKNFFNINILQNPPTHEERP